MAVIIPDINIPDSCADCLLCSCQKIGLFYCDITASYIDVDSDERDADCPLKSIDEMCNEIQNVYIGYRHGYEIMADVMNIINKYCKENTE